MPHHGEAPAGIVGIDIILGNANGVIPTGGTRYVGIHGSDIGFASMIFAPVFPRAGTLQNWYAKINLPVGAGETLTLTLRLNGVNTAMVIVIGGAVNTTGNDLINTVAIAIGDVVDVLCVASGAAAQVTPTWGLEFV